MGVTLRRSVATRNDSERTSGSGFGAAYLSGVRAPRSAVKATVLHDRCSNGEMLTLRRARPHEAALAAYRLDYSERVVENGPE